MKRTRPARLRAWWTTERLVLTGLATLLSIVVLLNEPGVLTPDTKPEIFLKPWQTAERFAAAWLDTPNLGTANYNAGVAPVAALFALGDAAGLPAWLIMRLWRIGLLLIAAWGARRVMQELGGAGAAPVASVAAAVAYAANPYVIVGGGTTPTLQPYALLPWLVVVWLRGFRSPSWRAPVLAGLVLAAMGGLNAGVVPLLQLVVVIPLVAHVLVVDKVRFRGVAAVLVGSGLVYVVLSLYWLVPAVLALGVGSSVADSTESTAAINMANSFPEVLRGLGMWTLYGADAHGSFDPRRLSYVTGPVVVVLTFGGPLLAALGVRFSRARGRLFAVLSVLVGALVMVGAYTGGGTLWGRALGWLVEDVPGLIAFRTTNKAGAVLELGLAVLIGYAAAALVPYLRTAGTRAGALVTAAAVVAGSVAPALSGDMFWVRMDMPGYWRELGAAADERGDTRVLMVPGTGVPDYTWGYSGPDELGPSILRRPFVYRSAAPLGGEYGANLLAGVDQRLHQGTLPPGAVSALATYLGAGDVVGRHDLRDSGPGAERVEDQLSQDPGLGGATSFGPTSEDEPTAPATLRRVRGVAGPTSVAARPARGALLVEGSGVALPELHAAGLLEGSPGLLLAGALDDEALASTIGDGARVVLTDSNARREWSNHDPARVGPLLPATEDPGSTRVLFDEANQTVQETRGNARVTTRGEGQRFGPHASGGVAHAFDGDRSTAWRFGGYGEGTGNAVIITPERPLPIPRLDLQPAQSDGARITTARVTARAGGRDVVRDVTFSGWASFPTSVELVDEPVSRLTIEVTGVETSSPAPVGFTEIDVPGVDVTWSARIPDDLTGRLPAAAQAAGVPLSDVPLDVLLRRSTGDVSGLADEEARLERELTLPDDRRAVATGTVRLARGVADDRIDSLAGVRGAVRAESSSRAFDAANLRASMALDGSDDEPDLETAWVPKEPVVGEWISTTFPRQRLESFTITQADPFNRATRALVSIDDGEPFEVDLAPETTDVVLPDAQEATRVRILLTERIGTGFVRISDIGLPRVAEPTAPSRCVPVLTANGREVEADLEPGLEDLLAGRAVPFTACGDPLDLRAGALRVGSVRDFAVDTLHLAADGRTRPRAVRPTVEIVRHDASAIDVRVVNGCSPCLLSSGQAFDARWTAEAAGRSLGPAQLVDGYAAGWRLVAEPGDIVQIRFGPARAGAGAWAVSAAALVGSLLALAWRPVRTWWRGPLDEESQR